MPTRGEGEPVYVISVAAQLTGMHPQTVRLYERLGLVCPQRVSNRNRMFSDEDIRRLNKIREFTRIGVNLAGVEVILRLLERVEDLELELAQVRAGLRP